MTEEPGAAQEAPYDFLGVETETESAIGHMRDKLRRIKLFSHLSDADLDLVARLGNEVDVQPGAVLMQQDEEATEMALVLRGRVRIEKDGQEVAHVEEGDQIGALSLLDGKTRSVSVSADVPTRLFVIQKHTFDHLLTTSPALKDALLLALCSRLRELQESY
ncbi:MAG: hypothetical protein NVSMB52_00350 [Chloroflexota bacterium]